MAIIPATGEVPPATAIDAAVRALESGSVVGVPTDTVYGLVADVSYTGSADKLFALKRRSRAHELPVIVADIEQAMSLTIGVPQVAERLMEKFWPGPLTLVLPRDPEFVADLGGDGDEETVGVRCPDHIVARLLCEEVGPLAITTANVDSGEPATTAADVLARFRSVSVILDAGECAGAMATVVDVTGETPKLLREGQITWSDITSVLQ
jgi:L-threonylcarbamoyladenylate synthase